MKKVPKGKCFANVKEVKQKMAEALKGIKIHEFEHFWAVEKSLSRGIAPSGEYLEGGWSLNM